MNIAILDSGIMTGLDCANRLTINDDMRIINQTVDDSHCQHGSICASIIHKYAPSISLSSINILDNKNTAPIDKIRIGLEWCIKNNIKVVNLSAGSVYFKDAEILTAIIERCIQAGIIIVAASSNSRWKTYPASFANVIGVEADLTDTLQEGQYCQIEGMCRSLDYCSFCPTTIENPVTTFGFHVCNSYAAPIISAHVCNILNHSQNLNYLEVINILNKSASKQILKIPINDANIEYNEIPIVNIEIDKCMKIESSKMGHFLFDLKAQFSAADYNAYVLSVSNKMEIEIVRIYADTIYSSNCTFEYILKDAWYSQSDIIIVIGDENTLKKAFPKIDIDFTLYLSCLFNNAYSINYNDNTPASIDELPIKIIECIIAKFCEED